MNDFLLQHEPFVRLAGFATMFAIMGLWELLAPRRTLARGRRGRWWANFGLTVAGTVFIRLALPLAAVGAAFWAQRNGIGIFNHWTTPPYIALPLSLVALDALIYAQHVAFHRFGLLWRLHKVHHADPDIDVTTGIRFHPLEILASMLVKMVAVAALGCPPVAVLLFEVVLNGTAMFNHGNVRLGERFDRVLRLFIVTPDMHLVHHSAHRDEQMRNFGFNLSLWDRLFSTYRESPRDGDGAMRIGLAEHAGREPLSLLWSLGLPFFAAVPTERAP
jgi:sterol desaturase/sphingolipid hydroxylase (fatty acid hydroxylase superfamily)